MSRAAMATLMPAMLIVWCCCCALAVLPNAGAAESAGDDAGCGKSLNVGLDYFLGTKLFANLTNVDLPAEIKLPLSSVKIANMRLTGLDTVARGCNLQMSLAGEGKIRLKACAHAARIMVSFVLKAVGYSVDFVEASLTDTSVSAQATVEVKPGGLVHLETFDVNLGGIRVENAGVSGTIITKLMGMKTVKTQVQAAITAQGGKRIAAELKKYPLPQ